MMIWAIGAIGMILLAGGVCFLRKRTLLVAEDSVVVTVDRNGFIKRLLPAGRQLLGPFEKVDLVLEIKTKLAAGQVIAVTTGEGIPVSINWSGTYSVQPDLITEKRSQRLRSLPQAERAIARNAEICLRRLVAIHRVEELFSPVVRERLERQLGQLLADRLKPLGITFNGLNLQTIELPGEVAEALTKARAIKTLDEAIRQLDPATREIVRGVYQLDEVLRWDAYLPAPSRLAMKQVQAAR
jgi:regulator of protease activity HflC (stomatin/prohibitin superfamily)